MKQNDIFISANTGAWIKFLERKENKKYPKIIEKFCNDNDHTCYYCGWKSKKHMHLVNKDGDYNNNYFSNLTIACSLCVQSLFVDGVGYIPGSSGVLIYLPQISQVQLNNLCRLLFCILDKDTNYRLKLQTFFVSLKEKSDIIEKHFGKLSSNPIYFIQGIVDSLISEDDKNHRILKGVRLLPLKESFPEEIEYFSKEHYKDLKI